MEGRSSQLRRGKERPWLKYYDVTLTSEDIRCLECDWLTDNNIAFWEEYLEREILVRYPQARIILLRPSLTMVLLHVEDQAAMPQVGKASHIFLPINNNERLNEAEGGTHWSLLLISVLDRVAFHYDSLSGMNDEYARRVTRRMDDVLKRAERSERPDGSRRPKEPLRFVSLGDSPQQSNSIDCGVFVCLIMRHLLVKRLLSAHAREKVSMSMGGKMVDSNGGRKEMLRIIDNLCIEGERRQSYVLPTAPDQQPYPSYQSISD